MHPKLSQFARKHILRGLKKLPEAWQTTFKYMYGRGKVTMGKCQRTLVETKNTSIETVVTEMSDDHLDWAMHQIDNSIKQLKELNK